MIRTYLLILLILIAISVGCFAQSAEINGIYNHSIVTTDQMLAPVVNPAALGYGNSDGIGWMQLRKEDKWKDHYWLFVNTNGLSYVYQKNELDQNTHTFATGGELTGPYMIPNLYTGTSYMWVNDKYKKGAFRSGVLYRPTNFASLGMTWDNDFKAAPSYRFGFGIRPFALLPVLKAHRLELSVDMDYYKDGMGDYNADKPTIGVNTEIFDGLKIGGTYNQETETTMLNFSLSHKNNQVGSLIQSQDDDNYSMDYIFMADNSFLPPFGFNEKKWYQLPIKQQVVTYRAPKYTMGPFKIFDDKQSGVDDIIKQIQTAKADPCVKGLIFINKNFAASLALKQEIITELKAFKAEGKQVAFYYDNISNGDYIFAAAIADKIYLNPLGSIDLKGIAVNSPYLKDALAKLGISVYNFRSHPYKTAGNMFSENEMTAQERAEYETILSSLYTQMCNMISDGRGARLKGSVTDVIDNGPYYLAKDALSAGLVDELVYETKLKDSLKKDFAYSGMTKDLPEYLTYNWAHPKKTKVAIVYAQGNIVMGKGTVGQKIAQQTTTDIIRRARKNSEYKGIILRVDSGGGSAQASDIIHQELQLAKSENKKPIVVSMSGVAGSGGYYISCNADHIVADPATITGSIGVIGISFSAENMFKKLYINWSTVKKGRHSDFGSMTRKWNDEDKDIMQNLIAATYHDFVQKVADGRKMDYAAVDSIAMGRIWTGEQGLKNGLVDELGGLKEATQKMKELAHIRGDIELVNVCKDDKSMELTIGVSALTNAFPILGTMSELQDYVQLYDKWRAYDNEKTLYLSPLDLEQISGN